MRKMDLVASVCEQTGLSRYVVKQVVDAGLEKILETTRNSETVVLPGFGRFQEVEGKDGSLRLRFFPAKRHVRASDGLAADILPMIGKAAG